MNDKMLFAKRANCVVTAKQMNNNDAVIIAPTCMHMFVRE